ncbi:MAG: RnfABCDGE type electron transport complex subunit G [Prevotellaceae bacterium]|nr:RnfABCDGE type electron transport complex subunit G [Prevotellaceae bacterium]
MKKLESTLKNMVAVLTGTAVLTGGVLAIVNKITEEPIAKVQEKQLSDGIKSVMNSDSIVTDSPVVIKKVFDGKEYEFVIHKAQSSSGEVVGAAVESTTQGFGGDLRALVGFDSEGNVCGYTILQSAETPGLGAKADEWFQKGSKGDIIGKKAGQLVTHKDDGVDSLKVDAITASTITSRAFLKAVNQAYYAYLNPDSTIDCSTGASKQANADKHHSDKAVDSTTGASKHKKGGKK